MDTVIEVRNLRKEFRELVAVDNLDFSVPQGKVYGFLGQNGAGKSTTIRMLVTLIAPTEGEIRIFGLDLARHRKEILRQTGAIIERPDLYKYLTALENLKIFATMSGSSTSRKTLMDQLEMVGLADRAGSKVKTYSQGMKQRLGIATALVHDPQLIILDEPTNGLDPQGIADIRNLILRLSREHGKTLVVSSHLLSEMEVISDSMLIIDRGKKLVEGKVSELFDPSETLVELRTADNTEFLARLSGSTLAGTVHSTANNAVQLKLHRNELNQVMAKLLELQVPIHSFSARHSLEDYFLNLTSGTQHVEAFKN
ncbi:MAG: ABC transporter ATP-binding protein [Chitinophagaceae bacterium]|nr:MAG: ABC transporter ATP-binding protein [Chitinophagaceae bacterium]